jgi:hypothetical protein
MEPATSTRARLATVPAEGREGTVEAAHAGVEGGRSGAIGLFGRRATRPGCARKRRHARQACFLSGKAGGML